MVEKSNACIYGKDSGENEQFRWRREVGNMAEAMSLHRRQGSDLVHGGEVALERCTERSSSYSQGNGGHEDRSRSGLGEMCWQSLWEFSSDSFNFVIKREAKSHW